jgi:hypothetical protein
LDWLLRHSSPEAAIEASHDHSLPHDSLSKQEVQTGFVTVWHSAHVVALLLLLRYLAFREGLLAKMK